MEEESGIILSMDTWNDLILNGKRKFIIQSISIHIPIMVLFSMFVNITVTLLYKIKPNLYQAILVFIVQPIFLATIYTIIEVYITYKFNIMVHDLKEEDRQNYKRYFIIRNVALDFIGGIILFINLESLTTSSILSLITLFIAIIVLSILAGLSKTKYEFNALYEEIIEKINQEKNKS